MTYSRRDFIRHRRPLNIALGLCLAGLVLLFFLLTLAKLGAI